MPKLVDGWVLGTHNYKDCKGSSLFIRINKNNARWEAGSEW